MDKTYRWTDLDRREQEICRKIRTRLGTEGWGATVSQIAKYWDRSERYWHGRHPADQLAAIVSAVRTEDA